MTLFGESKTEDEDAFFTGKPEVEGLGYAFAFRNYRSNLGKWQTADPLGYPDGWNNNAYVNNRVVSSIDIYGTEIKVIGTDEFKATVASTLTQLQSTPTGQATYDQLNSSSKQHVIMESPDNGPTIISYYPTPASDGTGSSTVTYLNPSDTTTRSDGSTVERWNALAHELTHAIDCDQGILDMSIDPETGIPNADIKACTEANRMLLEHDPNAQTRTKFGDKDLPPSAINPTPRSE